MTTLQKPIVFFDLETTGVNIATDRIVEISLLKYHGPDQKEIKTLRLNPTIPIPPQATAIHGIGNMDVADCPTFALEAQNLLAFIGDADLGGFNSNNFDIPLLIEEFLRVGINFSLEGRQCIDMMRIYRHFEKRDLTAALKFYCDKDLNNAHSAEADVVATFDVFEAQLQRYQEALPEGVKTMAVISIENDYVDTAKRMIYINGEAIFNFGKHKGKPVTEVLRVEPQYYDWMMKGDFAQHTKIKLKEIKDKLSKA